MHGHHTVDWYCPHTNFLHNIAVEKYTFHKNASFEVNTALVLQKNDISSAVSDVKNFIKF